MSGLLHLDERSCRLLVLKEILNHTGTRRPDSEMPVTIPAYSLSQCVLLSFDTRLRHQGKMSSRFLNVTGAAAMAAMLALSVQPSSA
ncbi:hypothetical protein, partial [Bradyrhizobium jicamae]|uniref:hypothetical protein n=1 Tax=Bradyrhizobium jicamae TaxID=280332 RepID=UPI001AECB830